MRRKRIILAIVILCVLLFVLSLQHNTWFNFNGTICSNCVLNSITPDRPAPSDKSNTKNDTPNTNNDNKSSQIPSKVSTNNKYVFNPGYAGLNNYLLSASNLIRVAQRYNRTLLIHPCIHNDHTGTRSFTFSRDGALVNNARACAGGTHFQQLFRVPDGVRYEIATESHPVWQYRQTIRGCGHAIHYHRNSSMEHVWDVYDQCFHNLAEEAYVYAIKTMYMGRFLSFDFSQMVYDLVKGSFKHRNLSLNDTMVIHVRLGDFQDYCQGKVNCYFSMQEMEPKIRDMKQKLSIKHVVIMSNGEIPANIMARNTNWTRISDSIDLSDNSNSVDHSNLRVIVEMATGVLAKYFVGNAYSSVSSSIAALRKQHDRHRYETITIQYLMGVTNISTYTI